jgi:hypothetical protein
MAEYYTFNEAAVAGVARIFREKEKTNAFNPMKDNQMTIEIVYPAQFRPYIHCKEQYQTPKIEKKGEYFIFTFGKEYSCKDFLEFIGNGGCVVFQHEAGVQIVTKQEETAKKIKSFVQRGNNFKISKGNNSLTVSLM